MSFQGHLNQEQRFQVYLRGCLDFGTTYGPDPNVEKSYWWTTICWRVPEVLPTVPSPFPSFLNQFLPHESGAPFPEMVHPLDWEMALIRAHSAGYPLTIGEDYLHLENVKTRLTSSDKELLARVQLAGAHFLEFRKFRKAKKFAHAEDQLRLAIAQCPEAAILKAHGAWLNVLKGHVEKALLELEDLPLSYPAPALQMAVRMGSLTRLGHAQHALEAWHQSNFPFPITPELAFTLSLAYAHVEDMSSSLHWLKRAENQDLPPEGLLWFKAWLAKKEGATEKVHSLLLKAETTKDLAWWTNGKI